MATGIPASASGEGRIIAAVPGLYEIRHDHALEIIRVGGIGIQRVEDADRYLAELGRTVAAMRARIGVVRLLADLRNSPVRSQPVAERIRLGNLSLYRPGDRVALLVESSLMKMQLRRNLVPEYQNIFMSVNAAETWLTAHDDVSPFSGLARGSAALSA